jgi:hypothetical protein
MLSPPQVRLALRAWTASGDFGFAFVGWWPPLVDRERPAVCFNFRVASERRNARPSSPVWLVFGDVGTGKAAEAAVRTVSTVFFLTMA